MSKKSCEATGSTYVRFCEWRGLNCYRQREGERKFGMLSERLQGEREKAALQKFAGLLYGLMRLKKLLIFCSFFMDDNKYCTHRENE